MTNRRAQQTKRDKPNFYHAKNVTDTTVQEMKAFVGIRLYMEYCCIKLSYRDYWNNEGSDFIGFTPNFRTVMTRDRFLAIWTFLHVIDEEDQAIDKADKIYKVRLMLNTLLKKFQKEIKPNQHLSLDEGMLPTKNRLGIKQYIKDKPTKWGIKSFLLCESDTGYIINAEIYTGAAEITDDTLGMAGNTAVRLVKNCKLDGKCYIVVMDRFYNSVILSKYLMNELKTGVVGTIQQNRKHFPKALKEKRKMAQGESVYRCGSNITCLVWQDRKPISFISNYHNPEDVSTGNRRNKDGTVQEITMPHMVKDYNKFMGGCDKNDQMTRLHRSRRHYRWPRHLFIKMFMWGCYNAYIIWHERQKEAAKRPIYFTRFIKKKCV